jgi:hypothetical protein
MNKKEGYHSTKFGNIAKIREYTEFKRDKYNLVT